MTDSLTIGGYEFFGGNYHVQSLDFSPPDWTDAAIAARRADPSARNWPFVTMHTPATRVIDGYILATTEALARAELAAIVAACASGADIVYQPAGESSPFTCRTLVCAVEPKPMDVSDRARLARSFYMDVRIVCETYPYWVGPAVTTTLTVPVGTPWTATLAGVAGDVPALTETRYTHAQSVTALSVGLRSNAGAAFTPTQVYPDSVLTCSGTYATIGTPTALDAVDMRGDFLVIARAKFSGATVGVEYLRASSSVAGPIGAPSVQDGIGVNPVTASSGGYDTLALGVLSVPAGRVQAGLSGGGYGLDTLAANAANTSATCTVSSLTTQKQTYKATLNLLSAVGLYGSATSNTSVTIVVYRGGAIVASGSGIPPSVAGWFTVSVSPKVAITPGESLTFQVSSVLSGVTLYRSTTSVYADGNRIENGVAKTDDLAFRVYERAAVVYGSAMNIQAKATSGTPTVNLAGVALIPTDEGAVRVTMPATTAGQGIDIDYLSQDENLHGIYIADATNTGTSLVATAEPYGPLLMRPGSNTLVGMAATPINAAPGNATVTVTHQPRYLVPFTGV